MRFAGLMTAAVLGAGLATAQVVTAPRYTGNAPLVEAPGPRLNLPAVPPAITPHGVVVENVVARVNDQIISRSDVDRSAEQLEADSAQKNLGPAETLVLQRDMLRDMIDQQLLLSKAKELNINVDAEVVRQLDEIRKQNNLATMDDLEKAARQQGVSFEDFKAQIRNRMMTQQVVRDEVGRRLQMTQAEENKYYEDHKKEFDQPEQVQLSEILVPLPETATPAEIVQAERKANVLKTQIMQGSDFAALAKKESGGPSAPQGGELGQFKRGTLGKVLEDATFGLKPGETTQPIRTRQGYVILKVTAHNEAGPAPLKSVEPQVQEAIYMNAMQPALRAYLTKLREEAYVDIQPGFTDSGATGKESKPLFTAYAPPAVKKKKPAKDKARFDRSSGRYVAVSGPAPKTVVAGPDTTGGRTLTGADAAPMIDPKTGLANLGKPSSGKSNKKVKKEKVRFGQAPRTALPSGGDEVAGGSSATSSPAANGGAGTLSAPGAVLSSGTDNTLAGGAVSGGDLSSSTQNANLEDNALNAQAPVKAKTRYSAQAAVHKEKKLQKTSAKKQEKLLAAPRAATTTEAADEKTQAAPLGLNGDTEKKQPKPKKVKGATKERLEDKKKAPAEAPVEVAPTANPVLAPTTVDTEAKPKEKPSADSTGLAPVSVPVQGQVPGAPGTPVSTQPAVPPPN